MRIGVRPSRIGQPTGPATQPAPPVHILCKTLGICSFNAVGADHAGPASAGHSFRGGLLRAAFLVFLLLALIIMKFDGKEHGHAQHDNLECHQAYRDPFHLTAFPSCYFP